MIITIFKTEMFSQEKKLYLDLFMREGKYFRKITYKGNKILESKDESEIRKKYFEILSR